MQLSTQTQAILLLTAWFGKQDSGGPTPLSPTEWGRFALYLLDTDRNPGDLLQVSDMEALLSGFADKKVTAARIRKLLERSAALGIALEKWQRAGLWVMTRSDSEYPKRWKHRLKNDAPPVLFGTGNRDLLNSGGIAVVGSRDLDESQVALTGKLGRDIAYQGQTIISGGARGADEAAMLGALESGGMAVGVLADSLLRTCTSAKFRKALMSKDLALVSPFNPEAGFNVGNAMARNKHIYCLSDAAIVIAATERKGGTWSGAVEDLRHNWVPLWILKGDATGNRALVEKGANWLPEEFNVRQLVRNANDADRELFKRPVAEEATAYAPRSNVEHATVTENLSHEIRSQESISLAEIQNIECAPKIKEEDAFQETPYQFFLSRLDNLLSETSMTSKELQNATLLKQKQLSEWLKMAEADGVVIKTKSPVKYQLITDNATRDSTNLGRDKAAALSKADAIKGFGF